MILSDEEKERSYGIQEKSLKEIYCKVLKLDKKNEDYIRIMKLSADEFTNRIPSILGNRIGIESKASIYDVS